MADNIPDWCQLPTELLQLISQKLNSEFYHLRFRSVCSTWRSSVPSYHTNHLPMKLPQLSCNDLPVCFLVRHTIFLIKPPTHQHQQQTLHPLLIRIGPNLNGKIHLWNPLDLCQHLPFFLPHEIVLDLNQLSIVDLGHVFLIYRCHRIYHQHPCPIFYPHKAVAAPCPGELQPVIVTLDEFQEPWMLRYGDHGWMKIPNIPGDNFVDICNFKGGICVVDNINESVMVGSDLSVDFVDHGYIGGSVMLCLAENELLLVDKYESSVDDDVRIDVYRLDEKKKKWVMLSNLGDRVLFMGNGCSFSTSASDLGFANGNCVIVMDNYIKCGMSVLNLDQNNRVLPLSDYPDYFKLLASSGVDRHKLHWEQ